MSRFGEFVWHVPRFVVKYRGHKPRGFTVLNTRRTTGRAVADEFNSPRPSGDWSVGIHIRTPGASVRIDSSTPPDDTRRIIPIARILSGVAFFPNCRQLRRNKIVNPRRNWSCRYGEMGGKNSPRTVEVKHRTVFTSGSRPEAPGLFHL